MGGILCIAGLLATSFAKSPAVMHFTYGLICGMAACFIYNSYYLVVGTYFKQTLSLAVGITTSGSGAAFLYTGPLLQALLDAFGWRNTFRVMTATFALVCILSLNFNPNVVSTTIVTEVKAEALDMEKKVGIKRRISFYCSVWTFPVFTFVVISLMVGSFGMYVPYINLVRI